MKFLIILNIDETQQVMAATVLALAGGLVYLNKD